MHRIYVWASLAPLWLSHACAPASHEDATLAIVDVHVLSMDGDPVRRDHMVVVGDDRILAVEPTDRRRLPAEARIVEGGGRYLTPGLWDMHVHAHSGSDDALQRALPLFVANGVTGVRDMGSQVEILADVRTRVEADRGLIAPRVVAAGPLLDGRLKPWYGELPLVLETPDEVPRQLDALLERGIDFFKTYDDLSSETFNAIAEHATRTGVPFAGHVPDDVPMIDAARARMRTIEHLSLTTGKDCVDDWDGWFGRWISSKFEEGYDAYYQVVREFWDTADPVTCDAAFAAMAEHDVFFTPTLDMELNDRTRIDTTVIATMAPQSQSWCRTMLAGIEGAGSDHRAEAFATQLEVLQRIRDAGVRLLAGSDTPNNCLAAGFSLHWELALLVEGGLTPLEALEAATTNAALALGLEEETGRVAVGYLADLLLLEANPLDDIRNTRRIAGVATRGRWHDATAIDRMKADALDVVEEAAAAEDATPNEAPSSN